MRRDPERMMGGVYRGIARAGRRWLGPVGGRLRFAGITLLTSFLAMVLSFGVIRWMTERMEDPPSHSPVVLQRAMLLAGFANELAAACNTYADVVGRESNRVRPDGRIWIDRAFRRDIGFLEHRMDNNPMTRLEVYRKLRSAVARCATMGRHPDDRALRAAALSDARSAIGAVRTYLEQAGLHQYTVEAPVRLTF